MTDHKKLFKKFKFPKLDENLICRLSELSEQIGENLGYEASAALVTEFNRLADVDLKFDDFQGVYGGDGYSEFVRGILASKDLHLIDDLTKEDLMNVIDAFNSETIEGWRADFVLKVLVRRLDMSFVNQAFCNEEIYTPITWSAKTVSFLDSGRMSSYLIGLITSSCNFPQMNNSISHRLRSNVYMLVIS